MVDTSKKPRKKAEPLAVASSPQPLLRRLRRWIVRGLAGLAAFYGVLVLLFSFVPPPINLYQISESLRLGGIEKEWASWDAVSYTHLDVYKRQGLPWEMGLT